MFCAVHSLTHTFVSDNRVSGTQSSAWSWSTTAGHMNVRPHNVIVDGCTYIWFSIFFDHVAICLWSFVGVLLHSLCTFSTKTTLVECSNYIWRITASFTTNTNVLSVLVYRRTFSYLHQVRLSHKWKLWRSLERDYLWWAFLLLQISSVKASILNVNQ